MWKGKYQYNNIVLEWEQSLWLYKFFLSSSIFGFHFIDCSASDLLYPKCKAECLEHLIQIGIFSRSHQAVSSI